MPRERATPGRTTPGNYMRRAAAVQGRQAHASRSYERPAWGRVTRSPADLGHVLGRLDEARLVDQVALFFAPHGGLDHAPEMVVGDARAHEVTQRRFLQREQAGTQAALGGQPDAVARRAE